jgi:hypothetical protein
LGSPIVATSTIPILASQIFYQMQTSLQASPAQIVEKRVDMTGYFIADRDVDAIIPH